MSIDAEPRVKKPLSPEQKARLAKKIAQMTPAQRQALLSLNTPRMVQPYFVHIPHPKQQVFLSLTSLEAMYGGAAGGGKSDALLLGALQYVDVPGYSALILRRTWPDLSAPGAILDRANTWLMNTPAVRRAGGRVWEFPTMDEEGREAQPARLTFGTMLREGDIYKYQSAEYQYVAFDELTHFSEQQYTYMFSRIRRPALICLTCGKPVGKYSNSWKHRSSLDNKKCKNLFPDPAVVHQYPASREGLSIFDIPLRLRSASNPGGYGHEWVKRRFVDPKTREPDAVFMPARLSDNPSVDAESYITNLMHLNELDRERLLNGDWEIVEQGAQFQRHWFKILDIAPKTKQRVRFWDNAATSGGGDYTVGALVSFDDGKWVIEDIIRGQWSPHEKENVIRSTAAADGTYVPIRMEQEPGSSGVDVIDHYRRRILAGYNFAGERSTGSKEDRAYSWSAAAEAGNVYLVAGRWNRAFLDEASTFPVGQHDDQIDAVSGAVGFLAHRRTGRLLV